MFFTCSAQAGRYLQQLSKHDVRLEDVSLTISTAEWRYQQIQTGEQSTPLTGQTTQPWPSVRTRSVVQSENRKIPLIQPGCIFMVLSVYQLLAKVKKNEIWYISVYSFPLSLLIRIACLYVFLSLNIHIHIIYMIFIDSLPWFWMKYIVLNIVESLSQVRRRLNGVEKERLEAATRSNAEVNIHFSICIKTSRI